MKESIKKVYKCEHCGKNLFVKHAMVKHEEFCPKNPKNFKKCTYCVFLERTKVEYTKFYFDGCGEAETQKNASGFKCTKLNKLLYPLKVERLGLVKAYPETFYDQSPMPLECEHFKPIN